MEEMIKDEVQEKKSLNFIEQKVEKDLAEGKNGGRMQTRFPPEPNGYLHIGHAKAIALDFGLAKKYGGVCNLRFDDTNPQKEDTEYMDAIEQDIRWLGFEWGNIYYASDYFQQLWDFAVWLIKQGRAYVDEQSAEEIAKQKGTTTSPGTNSPFRDRPVEENLRLFEYMNSGECQPGTLVLRAKIDMAHPNMLFRDPLKLCVCRFVCQVLAVFRVSQECFLAYKPGAYKGDTFVNVGLPVLRNTVIHADGNLIAAVPERCDLDPVNVHVIQGAKVDDVPAKLRGWWNRSRRVAFHDPQARADDRPAAFL